MKKSVLTAFITVVCATSSVMAADDNAMEGANKFLI